MDLLPVGPHGRMADLAASFWRRAARAGYKAWRSRGLRIRRRQDAVLYERRLGASFRKTTHRRRGASNPAVYKPQIIPPGVGWHLLHRIAERCRVLSAGVLSVLQ